MPQPRKTSQ